MTVAAGPALSSAQVRAVAHTDGSILLLAGAGTGKTTTLAYRVAHLLETGTAVPEEILCLTFTNRACREMSERIASIAGNAARAVTVRTVHSFCAWILRQTPQSLTDIGRDFTVCDQEDCLERIREVVLEVTGRSIADRPARILQDFIGLVKDCQLADPQLDLTGAAAAVFVNRRIAVERICVDDQRRFDQKFFSFLAKYGASIVRLYNLKLTASNTLDFSDLLLRADALLREPETAVLWESRFRYVQVDEVQDVSLAEYALIQKLCKQAQVLLCGDFNQTIYQWRGSEPDALIARFHAEFSPTVIELVENYRSSPGLLATAQNFLYYGLGRGQPAPAAENADVTVAEFETLPEEVDWICRTIEALHLEDYAKVAIITRTNKACAEICAVLKEGRLHRESPVRFLLADEFKLFRRAEVKNLTACMNLLANPADAESLHRVLVQLWPGIGATTVNAVINGYREGLGIALPDFADPRTASTGDFFEPLLDALDAGRIVVFDVESTGTDVDADEIVQLAAIRLAPDGSEAARFERFLRPTRPVGASERVHGFSDAMLAETGCAPAEALIDFLSFVEGCVLVGHNVGFDVQITAQNLRSAGITQPFVPVWYDTLDISRRFLKNLENHKLLTVAAALGAQNDPTHNAMDDILATADVLNALAARYLRPQTEARRASYRKYLPRFAEFSRFLAELRAETAAFSAPEAIARLSEAFGIRELYKDEPEKSANLLLFADFAEEFSDTSLPPRRQLAALLELTALSAGEFERLSRTGSRVAVITAHQSKGCEFDYVFLPCLQEGVFPTFQAVKANDVREESRVFYVSLTRAKKKLWLSWSHYNENYYTCKPSRFLAMLGPAKKG